ncbi:MAG: Ribonuclease Y [Candidatus Magasanikbacteria bacterium GW2011_GWA2_45_39]|uniref:Ribonuclease Y n=1 Tax=Candidatus Magasanikbacteria bacterium GW2011_GWA2_45_39 TaxID=1619041 RepID=A0A0G1PPS9_9BACT|nr:MAG: Ribonuclease Y [Candidatus Magasanikbacteria bacterium GW2011_GWA2_45_39]
MRVFVKPDDLDDAGMFNLARQIAQKIEQELQYPGEIKVTMIREKRIVEYAR